MPGTIRKDCPCPKTTCSRHTLCDKCEEAHGEGGLPFCRRPKRTLWGRLRALFGIGRRHIKPRTPD